MKIFIALILLVLPFLSVFANTNSIYYSKGDVVVYFGRCEWLLPKQKHEVTVLPNSTSFSGIIALNEHGELIKPLPPYPYFSISFSFRPTENLIEQSVRFIQDKSEDYYLVKHEKHKDFSEMIIKSREVTQEASNSFRLIYFWQKTKGDNTATLLASGISDEHWDFMLNHCLETYDPKRP